MILLSAIQFKLTAHTGPDSVQRLEMKKNKHSVNVHHPTGRDEGINLTLLSLIHVHIIMGMMHAVRLWGVDFGQNVLMMIVQDSSP